MGVVTISRQLGSAGSQVACQVARRLGYRVVWRELINEAARRAGVPEVALATIDDLGVLGLHPSLEARRAYQDSVQQVMVELADEGDCVIVGRAGQVVLSYRPDALHARIIAPLELRCQRIASDQNIPVEAARARVEASDRSRRRYLHQYYGVSWDDNHLYDLVINTGRFTVEKASDLICRALTHLPESAVPCTAQDLEHPPD